MKDVLALFQKLYMLICPHIPENENKVFLRGFTYPDILTWGFSEVLPNGEKGNLITPEPDNYMECVEIKS
ncbi:hypothetical protein [Acinetobacter sp. c1-l78]|uniref:hypothetical protein n=1 Tax=Acinetobacter sp. c1-l78 TaxID=3342803 RepID=UPI0035B6BF2A